MTDRNVVIAEIRRVNADEEGDLGWLRQLEADGVVTLGHGKFEDFKPVRIKGSSLSRDILDGRR